MTDRLTFKFDPNGSAERPTAVRRYDALDCRLTLDDARRMHRELDDVLAEAEAQCPHEFLPAPATMTQGLAADETVEACINCGAERVVSDDGTVTEVAD